MPWLMDAGDVLVASVDRRRPITVIGTVTHDAERQKRVSVSGHAFRTSRTPAEQGPWNQAPRALKTSTTGLHLGPQAGVQLVHFRRVDRVGERA